MGLIYGVGDTGGVPTKLNGKHFKYYKAWFKMLRRCYGYDSFHKEHYSECSVSEDFKSLPKFKSWCEQQKGYNKDDWELDKDILVGGNKIYSPETCCFVPKEINNAFKRYDKRKTDLPQGIHLAKNGRSFVARCTVGGKNMSSKWVETVDEAVLLYDNFKRDAAVILAEKYKSELDDRVYNKLISGSIDGWDDL